MPYNPEGAKAPSKSLPPGIEDPGRPFEKKRLDLKLLQKDVAEIIDVEEATIWNWENNCTSPNLHYIPRVVEFLGYVPFNSQVNTLGAKIVNYRRLLGITQKELAKRLGVDPGTLNRWERGKGNPQAKYLKKVTEFLKTASIDHQTQCI